MCQVSWWYPADGLNELPIRIREGHENGKADVRGLRGLVVGDRLEM